MSQALRSDFSKLEIVHTAELDWQPSPSPSVWRKRLELSGPAEAGRVTSVVRYDADSTFPSHPHPEGEEILVLEGVFSDEHGDYPAGTYLLNPEGFEHAPRSKEGCVLFVKLRQYAGDREQICIDTKAQAWQPHALAGVETLPLYEGHGERMHLTRIAAGAAIPEQRFPDGEEIFVLEGELADEHGRYAAGSWIRFPPDASHRPVSDGGCLLYVKSGHLRGR